MQTDDQSSNSAQQEQRDDQVRKPPYTMHGVLHYLQHEWSKYEIDKAKWEMERAEMQARICFLQGERKGQENLKVDLIRRIKMLEYCLKQERAKNYRLQHNGENPPVYDEPETEEVADPAVPSEVDAFVNDRGEGFSWKQGRQLLKQYLQEIGYTENILDVRSFRAKNLLGLIPEGDWPNNDRVNSGKPGNAYGGRKDEDSDYEGGDRKDMDQDTAAAMGKFDFLEGKDEWADTDKGAIDRLTEKYKSEKARSKRNSSGSCGSLDEAEMMNEARKGRDRIPGIPDEFGAGASKGRFVDINSALGLVPDLDEVDIKDDFATNDDESLQIPKWTPKVTLRSHLDEIRAMQFHPVEPILFTASEDGTIKMWHLEAPKKDDKHEGIEPIYTFRGHQGPVLCMDLSPTGDNMFTGGFDAVVCCWNVPNSTIEQHESYDARVLSERLRGHADIVWSVAYHSSDNRLVSASSDGTIKLWEPGNFSEPLLRTIDPPENDIVPTSVDFVSTEPNQLLVAYTHSIAKILDIDNGTVLLNFDFGEENTGVIARILSHPTMAITIVAGDDRKIRYFDSTTGKVVQSSVAHVEGISCLAVDPNGLYLLSGSHDGSLRLWNMEKKICLQEISAHRKKYDASVTCVAFHPSRPLIGSAGADALAKVFSNGFD